MDINKIKLSAEQFSSALDSIYPSRFSNAEKNPKNVLLGALHVLNEHEEMAIRLRYGLDNNQEMTLEEVCRSLGTTKERIRQIEAKLIKIIRSPEFVTKKTKKNLNYTVDDGSKFTPEIIKEIVSTPIFEYIVETIKKHDGYILEKELKDSFENNGVDWEKIKKDLNFFLYNTNKLGHYNDTKIHFLYAPVYEDYSHPALVYYDTHKYHMSSSYLIEKLRLSKK